jgi:RNA ligase (TIGR02306 family)
MTRFSWYRKLTKTKSKSFPNFISKTDEERLQNMPWVLDKHKDDSFYISEKIEGQSGTYALVKKMFGYEFIICSRTVRKFDFDGSNWSQVAKKFDIKNKLKQVGKDIAIQCEIIGPGIQGNIYKLQELDFYIFNVYDIKKKTYYSLEEIKEFCKTYNFKHVPIINDNFKLLGSIKEMIDLTHGKSVLYNTLREGLVFRTHNQKISFKAVDPIYLLGVKDENN